MLYQTQYLSVSELHANTEQICSSLACKLSPNRTKVPNQSNFKSCQLYLLR